MKRTLAFLALVAWLHGGSAPASGRGDVQHATPAFPPGNLVTFVGRLVVDLRWDPVPNALRYRLERDPGIDEIVHPESLSGKLFYRDAQSSGTSLSYRVCALFDGSEDCSSWEVVHLGWVKGQLYKDLGWHGGSYELDGAVVVMDGAVLTIDQGTVVSPLPAPSGDPTLVTSLGGLLQVTGEGSSPTILRDTGVHILDFHALTSSIKGSEGSLVKLDGVQVNIDTVAAIEYCELVSGSKIVVNPNQYGHASTLGNNQFQGSGIELAGGKAEITHNTFGACAECIKLRQGAQATITDNTFQQGVIEGVDVGHSEATIQANKFELGNDTDVGILVWPDSGGKVTVSDNTFSGSGDAAIWLYRNPNDPDAPPVGAGPPDVTVDGNVVTGYHEGVRIGDDINVEVKSNSLSANTMGVYEASQGSLSRVLVYDNCIAGNFQGLFGSAGTDARGNWWGSPLGPRIDYSQPRGAGDLISGGAPYVPFLRKDNCDRQVRNLYVCALEVTQAIQTYNNTVPLVAGKPAVVRVYPGSATGAVDGVSGELVVRRGDTLLGTLQALRPVTTLYFPAGCPAGVGDQYRIRSQKENGLLFKLPAEWMQGTLTLAAEVNPDHGIEERDYADNTKTVTMTVEAQRPVRVGSVPVNPPGEDLQASAAPGPESILQAGTLFRKIYPAHQVAYTLLPAIDWPYEIEEPSLDPDAGKHGALLLNTLGLAQMRLRAEGGWAGQAIDQVHGILPAGSIHHSRSEPTLTGGRGTAAYSADDQSALVYALGLNLGHDPLLSCSSTIDEWGYDIAADRVMPADSTNLLCGPLPEPQDPSQTWIGPGEYEELLSYNAALGAASPSRSNASDPQPYLLVGGITNAEGQVSFMPAWQVTASEPPLNPPAGTSYCLELRDAQDTVLESHCFDLDFTTWWQRWQGFQIALPLTGSPASLVLLRGPAELGRLSVSASPPSVTLDASQGVQAADAELNLSWTGHDGDGDALAFSVLYSPEDGASWLPVATNITATQYTLDLSQVPGGELAWVRVEASDGFHTAADSFGPFAVDDHGPLVAIVHPEAGSIVSASLTLSGYGYDLEDGDLPEQALVWTSDRDGRLGTGPLVYASDLLLGPHQLTLTATDSRGHSTSTSVHVEVQAANGRVRVFLPLVLRQP